MGSEIDRWSRQDSPTAMNMATPSMTPPVCANSANCASKLLAVGAQVQRADVLSRNDDGLSHRYLVQQRDSRNPPASNVRNPPSRTVASVAVPHLATSCLFRSNSQVAFDRRVDLERREGRFSSRRIPQGEHGTDIEGHELAPGFPARGIWPRQRLYTVHRKTDERHDRRSSGPRRSYSSVILVRIDSERCANMPALDQIPCAHDRTQWSPSLAVHPIWFHRHVVVRSVSSCADHFRGLSLVRPARRKIPETAIVTHFEPAPTLLGNLIRPRENPARGGVPSLWTSGVAGQSRSPMGSIKRFVPRIFPWPFRRQFCRTLPAWT